eukprot:TRINITY_DN800_c0_g1_i20.p1 TRINITY_DN800_c0_g1~~TRINITY_DN800_c0_g1_i20.p1  ORF type:complete len:131 (-),score=22.35 TRINITY_DN800_c0_g1_i20:1078-1470(-)
MCSKKKKKKLRGFQEAEMERPPHKFFQLASRSPRLCHQCQHPSTSIYLTTTTTNTITTTTTERKKKKSLQIENDELENVSYRDNTHCNKITVVVYNENPVNPGRAQQGNRSSYLICWKNRYQRGPDINLL